VQDAVLSHCETRKDRFAILDSPETINGGVDRLTRPRDSKYGAYYFPWIQVYDPRRATSTFRPRATWPASYSRVDTERGVHKAPANEIVRGALGLRYQVSKGEQDLLNPKGINCIRLMQGRRHPVSGALVPSRATPPGATSTSAASSSWWRRRSSARLSGWCSSLTITVCGSASTRTIASFLTLLHRNGALMGESADKAFFVKCDAETNRRRSWTPAS
jgi:phage tail sheath protein FI